MTNDEKAQYYDQWKDYFEPLARIRSEVVKANNFYANGYGFEGETLISKILTDFEVKPELENLIQTIINEIEDIEQTAPIQGG